MRRLTLALGSSLVFGTACVPVLVSPDDTSTGWACDPDANSWVGALPPPGLQSGSFARGQVVPDFRLTDQHGDEVCLWQFHGQVVVLDISTMWCAPCQKLAKDTEETWHAYRDRGFVYVTMLAQNGSGGPPEQKDLESWASSFGITAPIVGDPGEAYSAPATPRGSFPRVLVIDRELRIVDDLPAEDAAIRQAVEALL